MKIKNEVLDAGLTAEVLLKCFAHQVSQVENKASDNLLTFEDAP